MTDFIGLTVYPSCVMVVGFGLGLKMLGTAIIGLILILILVIMAGARIIIFDLPVDLTMKSYHVLETSGGCQAMWRWPCGQWT